MNPQTKTLMPLLWERLEEQLGDAQRRLERGEPARPTGRKVDDRVRLSPEDQCILFRTMHIYNGYAYISCLGTTLRVHRIVLWRIAGRILMPEEYGDHINGDTLDNRRDNLRICNSAQNSQNRHKCRAKSGYIGVYFDARRNRWRAAVEGTRNGKRFRYWDSSNFRTAEDAARGYNEAAGRLGFLTRNKIPNTRP